MPVKSPWSTTPTVAFSCSPAATGSEMGLVNFLSRTGTQHANGETYKSQNLSKGFQKAKLQIHDVVAVVSHCRLISIRLVVCHVAQPQHRLTSLERRQGGDLAHGVLMAEGHLCSSLQKKKFYRCLNNYQYFFFFFFFFGGGVLLTIIAKWAPNPLLFIKAPIFPFDLGRLFKSQFLKGKTGGSRFSWLFSFLFNRDYHHPWLLSSSNINGWKRKK